MSSSIVLRYMPMTIKDFLAALIYYFFNEVNKCSILLPVNDDFFVRFFYLSTYKCVCIYTYIFFF